jgi:hypothetical protein
MTIDEAMAILEAATIRARRETVRTPEIKAALRALLPHCRERWPLDQYWAGVGGTGGSEFGRYQHLNASLNGIALQLGRKRL